MFARSQKTCMRDMCILRDMWLMANNYALLRCLQARVMTNNNLEYFEMLMTILAQTLGRLAAVSLELLVKSLALTKSHACASVG